MRSQSAIADTIDGFDPLGSLRISAVVPAIPASVHRR